MDFPSVRDVAKAISANNKAVEKRVDEAVEVISERIDDVEKKLFQTSQDVKKTARSTMAAVLNAQANMELAPPYKIGRHYAVGNIVRHNEGLWQAFLDTEKAPGQDESGWVPLVNGVASHRVEVKDIRDLSFVTALSNGKVDRTESRMPVPLHLGKWEQGKAYEHGDMVMWDGCTWYCNENGNTDEPGLTKGWLLAAQQGSRGKPGEKGAKGEQGDRGAPGPQGPQGLQGLSGVDGQDADPVAVAELIVRALGGDEEAVDAIGADKVEVVKGLLTYAMPSDDRVQLFSRGAYQRGDRYERGDMVSVTGVGLYVALASTVADPATNSPDWMTVAVITPGGGGGGGGGGAVAPTTFLALTDTPGGYAGQAGLFPRVNPGETGLIFDTLTPQVPVTMVPPAAPDVGDLWYASPFNQLMVWDGAFWAAA